MKIDRRFKQYFSSKYGRMRSRVKHEKRYQGLECMNRQEWDNFLSRTLTKRLQLWCAWATNGYPLKLSPSIDRINPLKGYLPDNVRWITHSQNSILGNRKETTCQRGHPWIPTNLVHNTGSYYSCRLCRNFNDRNRWANTKDKRNARRRFLAAVSGKGK